MGVEDDEKDDDEGEEEEEVEISLRMLRGEDIM